MERIDKEDKNENKSRFRDMCADMDPNSTRGKRYLKIKQRKRVLFGLTIIAAGTWWLLSRMDLVVTPSWLFTWPVFLMAFGGIHLLANGMRSVGGAIMFLVGAVFFVNYNIDLPYDIAQYLWPMAVIGFGLVVLLRPSRSGRWKKKSWTRRFEHGQEGWNAVDDSEKLDSLVVFGGLKKDIISKSFKGGEVTAIMGGGEFYFTKADIEDTATLDLTVIMGGVKLVVPENWDVVVNATNILGGVEDKRTQRFDSVMQDNTKTLVITGLVTLGGIDIQSI